MTQIQETCVKDAYKQLHKAHCPALTLEQFWQDHMDTDEQSEFAYDMQNFIEAYYDAFPPIKF